MSAAVSSCEVPRHAVDGHALAGFDHDDAPYGDLVRIDLLKRAVALDVGVVRRDVHHGGDGLAALAHGVALEQLAYLVEEHDRGTFGHVRLGVREEDHRERAHGGDGHEETFRQRLRRGGCCATPWRARRVRR